MIAIIIFVFLFIAPAVLTLCTGNGFVLLLMIIIWIIDLMLLWFYINWCEIVCSTTPKISYRQFIALYHVMPEDFILNNYDIKYNDSAVDFMSFIDVMRYRHFHKNIEKHWIQQEQLQNQAKLIADLQCDLAREQADIDYFMKEHLIK